MLKIFEPHNTLIHKVTLRNYRCFGERQTATLAPLTLLVGENNAGKSSFMAMIRVLLKIAGGRASNFQEEPFDLGTFSNIVHDGAEKFEIGFSSRVSIASSESSSEVPQTVDCEFRVNFEQGDRAVPNPRHTRFSIKDFFFELDHQSNLLKLGTHKRNREIKFGHAGLPLFFFFDGISKHLSEILTSDSESLGDDYPTDEELKSLSQLFDAYKEFSYEFNRMDLFGKDEASRVFESAPIRSKPRRTYDPSGIKQDPEGTYMPMYLANLYFRCPEKWQNLKRSLTAFGRDSQLFDEIIVKPYGETEADPFQLQIRESGGGMDGRVRNFIDVGYGISQILPIVAELLRNSTKSIYLLQQPEVYLHPRAQAAFGGLLCQVANSDSQLLVETHSDYILDRIMINIRDRKCRLKPEYVSILFFERSGTRSKIHSMSLDEKGEIQDAPDVYRKFFMEEMKSFLGYA